MRSPDRTVRWHSCQAPDLSKLSSDELREFRLRIAAVIKTTDTVRKRIWLFDAQCRVVLDGARDENALFVGVGKLAGMDQWQELEDSRPK